MICFFNIFTFFHFCQIHAPLFIHTNPTTTTPSKDHSVPQPAFILPPKSSQSSPALSSRDTSASSPSKALNYNSDSDLSSVTKMLDCASSASNFKSFFASPEPNEGGKYLQQHPGASAENSPSPVNPIYALQRIADKNMDEVCIKIDNYSGFKCED